MKSIILLMLLCGVLFLSTIGILIWSLLRRNRRLLHIALIGLGVLIVSASYTLYTVTSKSLSFFKDALKPRTGEEIYFDVLGKQDLNCSEVLHYQDKEIPIMDFAIVLHFKTCKEEIERILKAREFQLTYLPTNSWDGDIETGVQLDWLNPKSMGDTIMVFEYATNHSQFMQTLWISIDSTEVYYREVN